jgi:hypothetical protein
MKWPQFLKREKDYQAIDRYLAISICVSFILLALCLVVNFFSARYALESASNPVTDMVLSNIPVYDVEIAFVYGPFLFWALVLGLCISNPHRIPYAAKCVVFLALLRSLFVSLTHIGPYPERIDVEPSVLVTSLTLGSDLFFSGHTAFPFLMALIFWKNKRLRYLFLALSIFFASVVLLGHVHYSIDVLGAFFITHSVYMISEKLFKKDWERFEAV